MAEAEGFLLACIAELARLRQPLGDRVKLGGLALDFERVVQLVAVIEVILDRRLAPAGHEDEMLDTGGACFLERILNDRLVHHRQHFLGHGLGGGQHPGAKTGHRKHGFADQRVSPNVL